MIKPILFNTDMVRALLANRKTATRRLVKPKYCDSVFEMYKGMLCEASPYKPPVNNEDGTTTHFVRTYAPCKAPYRPGDILYVRETFFEYNGRFYYKADGKHDALDSLIGGSFFKCRPSIHMPRAAARLFLRVTDVRVQQLKDITDADALSEGFYSRASLVAALLKMYPDCTADSWFWTITLERISKEEAQIRN